MLQTSLQNDTLLKQLHQTVEPNLSKGLDVTRELISPANVRFVDSISKENTLKSEKNIFVPVPRKVTTFGELLSRQDTFTMSPIAALPFGGMTFFTEEVGKPSIILPERKIERNTPDWVVGIFILVFVLFATVRLFFNKYLGQLLSSTINYTTASRMFRERSFVLAHGSFRLDVIFYLIFSLFLFQTFDVFYVELHLTSIVRFVVIFAGVLVYFGLKRLVYLLQANMSGCVPDTQEYLFNMNLYNRILGLFLLPVCLVVAFAPLTNPLIVIVCGLFIVGIFYFLLIFRGIKILLRKQFSIFYLILYLCALEILPLLFIYKLALE